MLDVHPPHESVHTWRDFFIHIATIVVGLIIAVGLEQTVEHFQHRHQRHELEAAIHRDCEANQKYIEGDIATTEAVLDWATEQASTVEQAKPAGPLAIPQMPQGSFGSPDAGVWPSAKASGTTTLLPPSAQNWLEYLASRDNETFEAPEGASAQLFSAYAMFDRTLLGHAKETPSGQLDLSTLPPAQRVEAVESLRSIAEQARNLLRSLLIYKAGNEYILSTRWDQLDTPEGGERYTEIFAQDKNAHPKVRFAFGSN